MKLMTALVDVSLGLASRMETNRRQYESECSKDMSKRASERLEELREKRRELQEQQEEIESMMNAVFKGVFVHRYRVRLKCLKALQGLYSDKENTPKLELFTNRFKDRILCMVLDKEFDVSVEALHEHAAYLVDSLWDSAGTLLRDWERITELLLEGAEGEEEGFSDREESALIEILVCSMRQAAEVHPPVGRTGVKRVLSAKDRKTQLQDRTKLTEHFIVVLPQLLAKAGPSSSQYSIMVPALKCAYLHVLWELSKASNSQPSQAELAQLKQRVQSLSAVCHSCLSDLKEGVREQAFMLLCDLLVICSPAMVRGGRDYLKPVVLRPSLSLRSELAGFVIDFVFVEPDEGAADEEDGGDSLQLSLLHRRRGFLAGFCKLLVYNVLELDAAADIFKHFLKFYNGYGDIIKETLSRARQIDKMQCAKTLCLSLQQLFSELVQETGLVFLRSSPLFSSIRDLARRLALTFGVDLIRIREPVVTLHK
ncbi:UNVERIFIED_CONTAM: hypothetical protein FKN15_034697 [Acipenser sinensis]